MKYIIRAEIVATVDADSPKEAEKAFYADEFEIETSQVTSLEPVCP